jgi:hypothetical protein
MWRGPLAVTMELPAENNKNGRSWQIQRKDQSNLVVETHGATKEVRCSEKGKENADRNNACLYPHLSASLFLALSAPSFSSACAAR